MDIKRRIVDPKTQHKAIALNYDFVMSLSQNDSCFSLNEREVTTILSILDYQRWTSRWYSNQETTIETATVSRFIDRLTKKLLSPLDCGNGGEPVSSSCAHYVGDIFSNISATAPPGCLAMDGTTHQQADYADLVPLLPALWKDDNAGTFTLPAMQGANVVGVGFTEYPLNQSPYTVTVGMTGGETRHVLTEDELASHSHIIPLSASQSAGDLLSKGSLRATPMYTGNSTSVVGSDAPHNNMSPYIAAYWYIQATLCQGGDDFAIQLQDCVLEYTFDGADWVEVNGWSSLAECLNFLAPDDLQFQVDGCILQYSKDNKETWNNVFNWNSILEECLPPSLSPDDLQFQVDGCILQYSKDNKATWNNVFNWNSILEECLPPSLAPDDLQFQVDGCILQYSKDNKETWNNVFNWNSLFECFATPPDTSWKCRAAKSHSSEFSTLMVAVGAAYYTWAELGYAATKVAVASLWPFTEGARFDTVFDNLWNMDDTARHELFDALQVEANVKYLASDMFYSLDDSTGGWTFNAIEALDDRVRMCESRPVWEQITVQWFIAGYYDDERGHDTWAWSSMAYVPEWACLDLVDDPCVNLWSKTVSGADVISADGWTLGYGTDTANGALSAYGAGNTARVGISQSRSFQAVDMSVSFDLEYVDINTPVWAVQCVLNGNIPLTLASGNTTPATIQAAIPDGVISGLMLSFYGDGDYPGTILITSAYLEGTGDCPFTACD